jgi:perosamine synthetase
VKIPITKPCFDFHEKEAVASVLDSGWVVQGPRVAEFELLFAEFTGSRYARAVSSCTAALHLASETLGIGEGDRVIVPSFTYVASANAVEYTGAEVLFCDIDLATFTIDVGQLRGFLEGDKEGRIKAIMPVHLFGLCAAMPEIMEIATQYGVKVVEDSACGFDAWIEGKHGGTFGDAGCFSFHPRKSLTTGEGGMVITNSEEVAGRVTMLRDHGAGKSDLKRHLEGGGSLLPPFELRGYNYRMNDMQGAIGVCQMEKAAEIQRRRRAVAKRYDEYLQEIDTLTPPVTPDGYTHGYQSYVCLFTGGEQLSALNREKIDILNLSRNRLMDRLEERGVSTRQGTHAVHTLGYYRTRYDLSPEDYINSYGADRLSIALPLYASLSEEEQEYVIEAIIACAE